MADFNWSDLPSFVPEEAEDRRDEVRNVSDGTPVPSGTVDAFVSSRRSIFDAMNRSRKLGGASSSQSAGAVRLQRPNTLAVGTFYNSILGHFQKKTTVYWAAVAPQFLSHGINDSRVYLTASNQSGWGCEALVDYVAGNEAIFEIWDWSVMRQTGSRAPLRVVSFANFAPWLVRQNINGVDFDVLSIANYTSYVDATQSTPAQGLNAVGLYNFPAKRWDLIYGPPPFQKGRDRATDFEWGPIIECHDPYQPGNTTPAGFAKGFIEFDGNRHLLDSTNCNPVKQMNLFNTIVSDPRLRLNTLVAVNP